MSKQQLATIGNFTTEDLQVMKQTLAVGTSDSQFQLFIRTAAAAGLNPFLNHIYAIVYGNKMSLQISVEGIHYLAKQQDGYKGTDAQIVCDNDVFKATRNKDGEWVIEQHDVTFPRGKTIAAYAIAYREGFKPYTVLIDADEVAHHLTGTNGANWKKYYNDFIKKTALKRALKGQFGIDINEDEQVVANTIDTVPDRSGAINIDASDIPPQVQEMPTGAARQVNRPNTPPAEANDENAEYERHKARLNNNFKKLGITNKDAKADYIKMNIPNFDGSRAPTLQELIGVNEVLEGEIELATMPDELE